MKNLAKLQRLQIKKCFVCGEMTVSHIGICSKCLREIDENYQESDWYKFLVYDHEKNYEIDKRDKKRLVSLKCIKRGFE